MSGALRLRSKAKNCCAALLVYFNQSSRATSLLADYHVLQLRRTEPMTVVSEQDSPSPWVTGWSLRRLPCRHMIYALSAMPMHTLSGIIFGLRLGVSLSGWSMTATGPRKLLCFLPHSRVPRDHGHARKRAQSSRRTAQTTRVVGCMTGRAA